MCIKNKRKIISDRSEEHTDPAAASGSAPLSRGPGAEPSTQLLRQTKGARPHRTQRRRGGGRRPRRDKVRCPRHARQRCAGSLGQGRSRESSPRSRLDTRLPRGRSGGWKTQLPSEGSRRTVPAAEGWGSRPAPRPRALPSPRGPLPPPGSEDKGTAGPSRVGRAAQCRPHSPLQHQEEGEPCGNLAESGAMQTLEPRCGHSMAGAAERSGQAGGSSRRYSGGAPRTTAILRTASRSAPRAAGPGFVGSRPPIRSARRSSAAGLCGQPVAAGPAQRAATSGSRGALRGRGPGGASAPTRHHSTAIAPGDSKTAPGKAPSNLTFSAFRAWASSPSLGSP